MELENGDNSNIHTFRLFDALEVQWGVIMHLISCEEYCPFRYTLFVFCFIPLHDCFHGKKEICYEVDWIIKKHIITINSNNIYSTLYAYVVIGTLYSKETYKIIRHKWCMFMKPLNSPIRWWWCIKPKVTHLICAAQIIVTGLFFSSSDFHFVAFVTLSLFCVEPIGLIFAMAYFSLSKLSLAEAIRPKRVNVRR